MLDAIIVDIDGTVAKRNERGIHEYHRVDEDSPHQKIIDLLHAISLARPRVRFIFVSGRPDSCFEATREWLWKNDLPVDALLMRKTGDYRKDFIVKQEIYDEHIKGKYHVWFVLDDRNQVVDMWRENGLVCMQVAPGNF